MPLSSGDPTRGDRPDDAPARILVVDDNDECRAALCTFLEAWDFEVHEASGGEEAVRRARELRPDLILMDIMMPGTDGLEATRRIRQQGGLAEVPIVAVSAMEGADAVSREAGCDACVAKPLDMGAFPRRVDRWLSGS
jgi:CheY-like chemotaxis protein